ncbi:hypothetical protein DFH94DRAFT_701596 [Russula ochroleuca]|uniref:Secreted protein n=1 Tax=Russula ochroleuca TaxID=152965 RepID=A0A9P5N5G4_9AGAM|nr:hypothetical protein DFH94DRAFT_701596 [Russula ochroleuca]
MCVTIRHVIRALVSGLGVLGITHAANGQEHTVLHDQVHDEGHPTLKASSRRGCGPSQGELAVVGPASLIINPESESWVWRVGN